MKKIECIAIAVLLIASMLPLLHEAQALDQSFPVYGVISDSDGDDIPTGEKVTITDVDKSTDIVAYTEQNDGSTGYYQGDLSGLENCENGDTITVSCTYNGETNTKSFVLDVTDTSKQLGFSLVGAPAVATDPAASVGSSSATLKGSLDDLNDIDTGECQVWFQYGTSDSYGSSTSKQPMEATGSFSASISGLEPDTTYHFRAVAENSQKKSYGSSKNFTTSATDPSVSTREAGSVGYDSAVLNGYLGSPGASSCDIWFVYDTTSHNNWEDYQNSTEKQSTASSTTFSESVEKLALDTTYHYRAVAENSAGKYDADDRTFTTHVVVPSVTTDGVDQQNVTSTSATLRGTLTDLGGTQHCTVWFEYGTSDSYGYATANLSLDDTGPFNVTVTGLQPGTAYRFRAVAENSRGTSYGTGLNFVTAVEKASVETGSVDYAVVLQANVTDLGGEEHCEVWFEYGPDTSSFTNTTPQQTIYETGTVTEVLTGLQSNASYRYRAVINNSRGVTYGSNLSFQMLSLPAAPTVGATDAVVSGGNVTFQANLTSLGDSSFCYVWFEYQKEERYSTNVSRNIIQTGLFNATVTGLSRGTYSFRAIAVGDTGRIAYSQQGSFTIGDQENDPPSVTLLSPDDDEAVTLDTSLRASVSDPDGDPAVVTFHLNGETIAAGTVHNGTTSIAPSLAHGTTYHWNVSVSDGQNTTLSANRTFSTIPSITVNFTHAFLFNGEAAWFADTSDGAITSREWTFDQETTATGANVTHAFDTAGSHTVTLTVTDEHGATFSRERAVIVWRRGDATMDGRINALDITTIELALEHTGEPGYSYPPPADVDQSGDLTGHDVTFLINKKILGLT